MTSCSGLFDFAAVDELKRLAAKYSNSLPQFALRLTLNNPGCRHRAARLPRAGQGY